MKTITEYAKSIFFILIFLQVAPPIFLNIKKHYGDLLKIHTNVGRIKFDGAIMESTFYAKNLKTFFKNPDIKAILLVMESPGGAAGSSQALFNEIQELKKKYPKPIITLSENICASGAYYIACATDKIIATRSALIGSVGTCFNTFFNFKNIIEKYDIATHTISAGAYKTTTNQYTSMTDEQKNMLQELTNNCYQQFTTDVAKTRKLSLKEKDKWANGRIFTGQQAVQFGLIDYNGSYSKAVTIIKSMAPIEGSINWIDAQKDKTLLETLASSIHTSFVGKIITSFTGLYKGSLTF